MEKVTQARVAIYIRVSTAPQADADHKPKRLTAKAKDDDGGSSLITQEQGCRAYAEDRSYQIVGVFADVSSGAHLHERQQMSVLRDRVRAGEVDVVLTYALDRLSRNQAHVYILDEEFQERGCRLEFVTESYEDSAVGRFIRSGKAFAAEVEREKIIERTMTGKRARVAGGSMMPGSRPRYGYQWSDEAKSRLIVHPERGPVVEDIWTLAERGTSTRAIASQLTARGVPTPTQRAAGGWTHSVIRSILTDPIYTGRAAGFRWETRKVRSKTGKMYARVFPSADAKPLPDGTVEPLVTLAVFEAVQQRLQFNKQDAARNNRLPQGALLRAGYARCGYCGRSMVTATKNAEYRCVANSDQPGKCVEHPTMFLRVVDPLVWAAVVRILTEPGIIEAELGRLEEHDPTEADLRSVERTLSDLTRREQQLIENLQYVQGDAAAAVGQKIGELGTQRRDLDAERAAVIARRDDWLRARDQMQALNDWRRTVADRLDLADYHHRRMALHALGVRVSIWKASHTPRAIMKWGFPMDPNSGSIVDLASSDSIHNRLVFSWELA